MKRITIIKLPTSVRSGVYLLKLKGKIVYVGQSINAIARLAGHKDKKFDTIEIRWMFAKCMLKREAELIKKFKPKHNITKNSDTKKRRFKMPDGSIFFGSYPKYIAARVAQDADNKRVKGDVKIVENKALQTESFRL